MKKEKSGFRKAAPVIETKTSGVEPAMKKVEVKGKPKSAVDTKAKAENLRTVIDRQHLWRVIEEKAELKRETRKEETVAEEKKKKRNKISPDALRFKRSA